MHHPNHGVGPAMNQAIFNSGLSVETISVYLLICGLSDAGRSATFKNLTEVWNGSVETLEQGLQVLEDRRIISRILSDGDENHVFKVMEFQHWKT